MIKSISKCMQVMSVISDGRGKPVSLAIISQKTLIPKPTCVHILQSLIDSGYVERIDHNSGYVLGPSTFYLTRFGKYDQSYVTVCRPIIKWLHNQTGYTVVLAVIQGRKKYILDYVNSERGYVFQRDGENIFTDDIYRTATGRIILSHMTEQDIEKVYSHYGPPTKHDQWDGVDSIESIKKALLKIKNTNFYKTETYAKDDTISLGYAMPIFKKYVCIGAIGVSVIVDRKKRNDFLKNEPNIIAAMSKASKEINRRLKFTV